jgi:hypothetical protein
MKPDGHYKVRWYCLTREGHTEAASVVVGSFREALEVLPHGPKGWTRYQITRRGQFVERGDPVGPRGEPANERYLK